MSCNSIEEAMEYIKGYCNKHKNCEDNCRLYDGYSQCFLTDATIPCDWEITKDGVDDDD